MERLLGAEEEEEDGVERAPLAVLPALATELLAGGGRGGGGAERLGIGLPPLLNCSCDITVPVGEAGVLLVPAPLCAPRATGAEVAPLLLLAALLLRDPLDVSNSPSTRWLSSRNAASWATRRSYCRREEGRVWSGLG